MKTHPYFFTFLFFIITLGGTVSIHAQSTKEVNIYLSQKGSKEMLQSNGKILLASNPAAEMRVINIYPDKQYQEMYGFGGAITETAAYNFMSLSKGQRANLAKALFDPSDGAGFNFCRTHINSADFSLSEYSYVTNERKDLATFSIDREKKYVVPMIKAAMQYEPSIYLIASPWSPPAWMKDSKDVKHGGKLLPEYYDAWGLYFAKYMEGFKKEGINFFAVSVQNEARASQVWESCLYTGTEEGTFAVQSLRPQLNKAGFKDVKIMIWDHNKERVLERATETFAVPGAKEAIWGVAFHWYSGGHFSALQMTHEAFPTKPLILTEFCCGNSRDSISGSFSNWNDVSAYANEFIGDFNNYGSGEIEWNLVVDMKGGPYHYRVGGCKAPVVVDASKDMFYLQPIYYAVAHFSRFVKRGAHRIGSSSYSDNIKTVAFKNPDGSMVVVLFNKDEKDVSSMLRIGDETAQLAIPGNSLMTLVIK